jgi:carboxyl-terminal processing protease
MYPAPRRAPVALVLAAALALSASCTSKHACGPGCENAAPEAARATGRTGSGPEPAAQAATATPGEDASAGPALVSAEALAAFDQAWETIRDTHFDPAFNGVDWVALRDELRPRAGAARDAQELRDVIGEMLERLGQSHFEVFPADALPAGPDQGAARDQAGGIGIDVRLRAGELLVSGVEPGSAAAEAGVEPGWIVRRVGELDVARTLERLRAAGGLDERSIAFRLWSAAQAEILGAPGSAERALFLDRAGNEVELSLVRREREVIEHEFGTSLPPMYLAFRSQILERDGQEIGLIHFSNWFLPMMKPIDQAVDRMRRCRGMVLDLRGNTGGAVGMVMGIAGHFFDEPRDLGIMRTRDSTLTIRALPRRLDSAGALVQPFSGPLAILVDETTGSASEVFAGGLQSVGRARVFGETSAGAVLPATLSRLPSGDVLLHALGDFETPDGVHLEGQGVIPDQRVLLERADLLSGRDRALEAALDWIVSQKGS